MKPFKNTQSGELTIVGNGPSADHFNAPRPVMGLNTIPAGWTPDWYCCVARELIGNTVMQNRLKEIAQRGMTCFINIGFAPYIGTGPNIRYLSLAVSPHPPLPGDWIENGTWVYSRATVMMAACQIAQYLGYNSVRLVGCDGYKAWDRKNDINHYTNDYNNGILPDDLRTDAEAIEKLNKRQRLAYDHIERELRKRGVAFRIG